MTMKSKRKKWANDHALHAVHEALRERALNNMRHADTCSVIKGGVSVHVVRECDLRSTLEEKATQVHRFANWTAFVNRAGTLIHVTPKDGDFHLRLPLYGRSVKGANDSFVERLVQRYAEGRLI